MPSIPVWFTTSQGPFSVVMTPQTVGALGALSDTTPVATFTADLDDIEVNIGIEGEDIRAMNTILRNMVRTGEGATITLVEILKYTGTNLAALAGYTNAVFKIVVTRGAQAWTGYGRFFGYTEGLKNGKSVGRLTLEPVGIAVAYA